LRTTIGDFAGRFRKARSSNSDDASFPSRVATTTEPTSDGVVDLTNGSVHRPAPQWLYLVPYGVGDADDVFDMVVLGWRRVDTLWVPTRLLKVTCTLSAAVGVSGAAVADTERFCDTVASAAVGVSNVTYTLHSPADDTIAHVRVSPEGCERVEVLFDMTTGSPTSANCLVAEA